MSFQLPHTRKPRVFHREVHSRVRAYLLESLLSHTSVSQPLVLVCSAGKPGNDNYGHVRSFRGMFVQSACSNSYQIPGLCSPNIFHQNRAALQGVTGWIKMAYSIIFHNPAVCQVSWQLSNIKMRQVSQWIRATNCQWTLNFSAISIV